MEKQERKKGMSPGLIDPSVLHLPVKAHWGGGHQTKLKIFTLSEGMNGCCSFTQGRVTAGSRLSGLTG